MIILQQGIILFQIHTLIFLGMLLRIWTIIQIHILLMVSQKLVMFLSHKLEHLNLPYCLRFYHLAWLGLIFQEILVNLVLPYIWRHPKDGSNLFLFYMLHHLNWIILMQFFHSILVNNFLNQQRCTILVLNNDSNYPINVFHQLFQGI